MLYILPFQEKAKLLSFDFDDIIMREGDPAGGIYVIISGMVRVSSVYC
jgi:CRP-like cAMP-binding protein